MTSVDCLLLDAKHAILDDHHRKFQALHDEGRVDEAVKAVSRHSELRERCVNRRPASLGRHVGSPPSGRAAQSAFTPFNKLK